MRALSVLMTILLMIIVAQAAVLKVASDGTQTYSDIQAAIDAASPTDSIIIQAGAYSGFTIDKRLVIIGSGTGTGIGEGVLVSSFVSLVTGSDSTELRSIWILDDPGSFLDSTSAVLRIHSGVTGVFVWRCFLENNNPGNYTASVWLGEGTSAEFVQCTFTATGELGGSAHYGIRHLSNISLVLTSCQFSGFQYSIYEASNSIGTISAKHCVFATSGLQHYPLYSDLSGVLENCAFFEDGYITNWDSQASNVVFSYCAGTYSAPPGATNFQTTLGAVENVDFEDTRAADYNPSAGSDLIDAGNPGSPFDLDGSPADIGIYGGQHPYVDGGVPDYPFAVQVEVPYSAPLNGTMRIWGRGRVGPGN